MGREEAASTRRPNATWNAEVADGDREDAMLRSSLGPWQGPCAEDEKTLPLTEEKSASFFFAIYEIK